MEETDEERGGEIMKVGRKGGEECRKRKEEKVKLKRMFWRS